MDKQNLNKRRLERTLSRSFDLYKESAKKQKLEEEALQAKQDHAISDNLTGLESSKGVVDSKGKGILQQDSAIKSLDTKGKDIVIREYNKAIYKIPDKKLQTLSNQGNENVENQGQTVLDKTDDELDREAQQLGQEMEHVFSRIRRQAQFSLKSQDAIWKSDKIEVEQKREYTRLLEEKNKKFIEDTKPIAQSIMRQIQIMADERVRRKIAKDNERS